MQYVALHFEVRKMESPIRSQESEDFHLLTPDSRLLTPLSTGLWSCPKTRYYFTKRDRVIFDRHPCLTP